MNTLDFYFSLEDENNNKVAPNKPIHKLQPPRQRSMNDDERDDFVAIDFETMTSLRTSACAIGMVKVIDGEIVQQFYSLINPVRDEYTDSEPNRKIHGIALETAEKAAPFPAIFEGIRLFIGALPIVCHNKSADIAILNQLMDYYNLTGIDTSSAICTYQLTGKSLEACCKEYGIKNDRHHNALWDAEVCARIYLELIGKPIISQGGNAVFGSNGPLSSGRVISKEHRYRLDSDQINNKNTIFYNSTVVITGIFENFPARDELASKLQLLGAKITSSISKKTSYVIVGNEAGPKKIEKIKQLQNEGFPIKMIREHELEKFFIENNP